MESHIFMKIFRIFLVIFNIKNLSGLETRDQNL